MSDECDADDPAMEADDRAIDADTESDAVSTTTAGGASSSVAAANATRTAAGPLSDPRCLDPLAGAAADVDRLISSAVDAFNGADPARLAFELFSSRWKAARFSLIFCGRQMFRDLHEFTEHLFFLAAARAVDPERDLAERVAALYILYGLYFKQPILPKVRCRLTHDDHRSLLELVELCRQEGHYDVVYCWVRLTADHGFHYCAARSFTGIEMHNMHEGREVLSRKTAGGGKNPDGSDANKSVLMSEDFARGLDDLERLHRKYEIIKASLKKPGEQEKSLSMVSVDLPDRLREIAKRSSSKAPPTPVAAATASGCQPTGEGNTLEDKSGKTIGDRRKVLRDKAYGAERVESKRQAQLNQILEATSGSSQPKE